MSATHPDTDTAGHALTVPSWLPDDAQAELAAAVRTLETSSLAVRLAALAGSTVEGLKRRLPGPMQSVLDWAVRKTLDRALRAAMATRPDRTPDLGPLKLSSAWMHRGLAVASGVAGGTFGLPGTLVELPVSTGILLRRIAAIAAEEGEDLDDPLVAAECMKVFALGGRDPADDAAESGYFALRVAMTEMLRGGIGRVVGTVMPGFIGAIATRFTAPVGMKVTAQAMPLLGAAAGAAVNLAFLEHFSGIAHAHFTVRRLEREHGAAVVRRAYEDLHDGLA
ncbi:EcsC family protein [Roseomonas sp. NAR14]|uniref:EcsC family protein n=1 Tax=Roseomonas acroporae TaxID=2937791 RepID=A0A9X1YGW1_9PROT|nr:EcsC family protein [Roseomonas acroporae]MCK8786046.1 EcsC family protein [Roseomonas acroporae]